LRETLIIFGYQEISDVCPVSMFTTGVKGSVLTTLLP